MTSRSRRRAPATAASRIAFAITSGEIDQLDERGLQTAVNFLLREEGFRSGIPQDGIVTSENEKARDEGIDASVESPETLSEWIPKGDSCWQFKAYAITPAQIKKELTDPKHSALQGRLRAGAEYVLMIGADPGPTTSREKAVREALSEIKATGGFRVLTSPKIAAWASRFAAFRFLPYFQTPGLALRSHPDWSNMGLHTRKFIPTEEQSRVIAGIQEEMLEQHHANRRIRLNGFSGLGKTRCVLESTRHPNIIRRVLYAENPDEVHPEFLAWIRRVDGMTVVLVVDNCEGQDRLRIEGQLDGASASVYLVTVGPENTAPLTSNGFYALKRMTEEELRKVLRGAFIGLSLEDEGFIIRLSSGFVKAAILLARHYQSTRTPAPPAGVAATEEVDAFIRDLIGADPQGDVRAGLSTASVVTEMGVEGGLEEELEALAKVLGYDGARVRRGLEIGSDRDIVEKVGRRRRVTPEILAIRLAAESWGAHATALVALYESPIAASLRERILRRLASLGRDERTVPIIKRLLDSTSVFSTLKDLNARERSELLNYLTSADPQAGLEALERLLGSAGPDELKGLNGGRRAVVATLERLVWLPDTFERAATLLLSLAEAENERYANNATGIWQQLFRPLLSGSNVPAMERLQFLERQLDSSSLPLARRLLAMSALEHVFEYHIARTVIMDSLGGRPLPPEWRPSKPQELSEVLEHAFTLLERRLVDTTPEISVAAQNALFRTTRTLFIQGLGARVLSQFEMLAKSGTPELIAEVVRTLGAVLSYDTDQIHPEIVNRARSFRNGLLTGNFAVRVRRWLGRPTPEDFNETGSSNPAIEESRKLADEALRNPSLLDENWEWLLSEEAQRSWWFFERLGERDGEGILLKRIESKVRQDGSQGAFYAWAAALQGLRNTGQEEFAWKRIEEMAADGPGEAVLEALWRSDPSDRSAELIARLVSSGRIDPGLAGRFVLGNWIGKLSVGGARKLVASILGQASREGNEAALSLLGMRIHTGEDQEPFQDLIWEVLERTVGGTDPMVSHYWAGLARPLLEKEPGRLGVLVLELFKTKDHVPINDERLSILQEATSRAPGPVWHAISTELEGNDSVSRFSLRHALKGQLLGHIPTGTIMKWVLNQGESGAVDVMSLTEAGPVLSDLQRELLMGFPKSKRVRAALLSSLGTGVYWGARYAWLERQLETVRAWSKDSEPLIGNWARSLIQGYEADIEAAKISEAEEGF